MYDESVPVIIFLTHRRARLGGLLLHLAGVVCVILCPSQVGSCWEMREHVVICWWLGTIRTLCPSYARGTKLSVHST